jgi:hypothetical protein
MNIGIRLHDTAPGTLGQRLGFARSQGFSCIHLALSKVLPGFSMKDAPALLARPGFAESVSGPFRRTGMDCALLGCYLCLTHPDPAERQKTREIYEAHLAFCREMGAWMVGTETPISPESPLAPDAARSEEAFNFFLENLEPLLRRAEQEDVVLAIEPVYGHIISTPERAERMLREMDAEGLIPETVTATSPFIATILRQRFPNVKIRLSVNQRVHGSVGFEPIMDLFDSFYATRERHRETEWLKGMSYTFTSQAAVNPLCTSAPCWRRI